MAEMQTLRIDTGGYVREVTVRCVARERWRCPDGHHEMTPLAAVRAWAYRNSVMGVILAPNEPTRAELAAQLAAVTAERDDATNRATFFAGLVSEVVRAVEPRDGETLGDEVRRVTRERDALAPLVAEARRVMHFARAVVSAWAATTADAGEDWDGVAEAIRTLVDEAGDWTLAGPHTTHDALAKACDNAREERDAMRRERDVLRAQQAPLLDAHDALVAAARAAGWTGAGATGAELVAWVRRGALLDAARIAMERGGERAAKGIVARANEEGGA